ncbi:MAG: RNA methyltransferase [candidate division KSB1 bacterium]|nr:RNA methyltransferase [candidate division KSB1 bacterium]
MPSDAPQLFIALLHYPVYNKVREVVATSLTTLNLHDLARLAATYGSPGFYVVTPLERQREVARRMLRHWTQGYGATYNPTRAVALRHMHIVEHLEAVKQDILQRCGVAPHTIATDARRFPRCISYTALRQLIWQPGEAFLLLLGTGWGLAEEVMHQCEYILAPIYGLTPYNHLPVRVAAGIMLDRLLGHAEAVASASPECTGA